MQDDENQGNQDSGICSAKSMLEKLTEHYLWCIKIGHGGHAVGYYSEISEKVQSQYLFPKGAFTLKRMEERFFLWYYSPQSIDTFKNNP